MEIIPESNVRSFERRLSASPAYGKVVGIWNIFKYYGRILTGSFPGVGLKTAAGVIVPYVRLDTDNTGKGIHFNATQLTDTSKKLAAVITPTVSMTSAARTQLYMEYIKGLENRSAQFIWTWWSTGSAPA